MEGLGAEDFKCAKDRQINECKDNDLCGHAIVATVLKHDSIDLTQEQGRQRSNLKRSKLTLKSFSKCIPF